MVIWPHGSIVTRASPRNTFGLFGVWWVERPGLNTFLDWFFWVVHPANIFKNIVWRASRFLWNNFSDSITWKNRFKKRDPGRNQYYLWFSWLENRPRPFFKQSVFPTDKSRKTISGNLPFLMQSVFPLFRPRKTDRKKSTSHLVDIFGRTDRMALSVFPVQKVQAWSLHAVSCKTLNHTV